MRPFDVKLLCCIGLLIGLAILVGCGSGNDLLDPIAFQYSASMVPQDGDENTDDIDIFQNPDCDGNGTVEDYFDLNAEVTIESVATAPDLRINRYVVEVTPLHGVYTDLVGNVISFSPPALSAALTPLTYLEDTIVINSNGTLTFEALIWPASYKERYRQEVAAVLGNQILAINSDTVYNVHVTFYATDAENNDDITFDANMEINLSAVDNCT